MRDDMERNRRPSRAIMLLMVIALPWAVLYPGWGWPQGVEAILVVGWLLVRMSGR